MGKKTIDQMMKEEILQKLDDRFFTSAELEAFIEKANSCCGVCCQANCMKLNCSCNEGECCKLCPCKKK